MNMVRIATVFAVLLFTSAAPFAQAAQSSRQDQRSAASTNEGSGSTGTRSETGAEEGQPQERSSATPIAVAEVSEQYRSISVGGRLQPKNRVVHQATASGYVLSVDVREGELVNKGQKLFSIDKDELTGRYKPVVVTARIPGMISEVLIQREDEVTTGDSAITVIGMSGYSLEATVSDKDAFKVRIGQQVEGHTSSGKTIQGVLTGRSLEPDYETGLFSLTFEFPNGQSTHVGEYLIVDLPVERTVGIFVRRDLAIRRYGRYYLWIINDSNVLEAREVTLGQVFGDQVMIERGLAVGERYLARLSGREKEGMRVDASEG